MTTPRTRLASAHRHLDVFEESWKADHAAAMECRDIEEFLTEAVILYQLLEELVSLRRKYVFRGLEETTPDLDQMEQNCFARWLDMVEERMPRLESLEQTFGAVEGADQVRECVRRAKDFLDHWTPPAVSMAVGLRVWDVSEEEADELRALLNSPPGAPGRPTRPPRSLPRGDSSLLQ